jgi:enamine deaminase RidA (YjgF/YER057c/UK114 family)
MDIWLKDIRTDFAPMNEVWNSWVVAGHKPTRCCGESRLARDELLVEFIAVAAQE